MDYTPLNRHEKYLNAIRTGDTTNLPQPINREEMYLYDIAMNGGGGGGTTDAVKYTEQSLTAEQQAQARTNIGAANANDVQTKNLATPLSISGTSQNTVESALGAISKKTSLLADINRNLGTEITAAQKLAIATGTFEDLPIGAYWTLNGTVYRIAHHDYYLRTGDTECTSHHIVVVPDNSMYNAAMNDTSTTTGGYVNSKMRTTNLATALSTFETDFGVAHILNHRILITNAVSSDGQASGWAWADSKVDLMSENMVFGHPVWGKAGYETGVERGQLALFSLYPEYIQKQRLWYWLRSVYSESRFCGALSFGSADHAYASYSSGVRPYACIYFDDVL